MLPNLKNYIIGTLLILVCLFGYTSYSVYGNYVESKAQVVRLKEELVLATRNVDLARESCKSGEDITKGVNLSIKTQMDRMTKRLEGLAELSATTLQDNEEDGSNTTTGARSKYADGSRLSPDLMRVLNDSYCDSNKNDSTCTAK